MVGCRIEHVKLLPKHPSGRGRYIILAKEGNPIAFDEYEVAFRRGAIGAAGGRPLELFDLTINEVLVRFQPT
jgi:hypothetical protein